MVDLKYAKPAAATLHSIEPIHFFAYPRPDKGSIYVAPNNTILIYQQLGGNT